ncbi:hypothetical protein [Alkaliphilus hydrothermalis]|uniref:hypothetical protein n=1 Tax=Alkaliphilus hydrothermalis TaxID=1482730 RepID=UPI0019561C9B|nr:hypothetical protein [Alkaliphilus hydrothermalis]
MLVICTNKREGRITHDCTHLQDVADEVPVGTTQMRLVALESRGTRVKRDGSC